MRFTIKTLFLSINIVSQFDVRQINLPNGQEVKPNQPNDKRQENNHAIRNVGNENNGMRATIRHQRDGNDEKQSRRGGETYDRLPLTTTSSPPSSIPF